MKTHIKNLFVLPVLIAVLVMSALGAQAAVVFTSLYSFTGTNDGANPQAALVQGSDGYFYGTTLSGGAYTNQFGYGNGTVFKINTNGTLTSLYSFTGGNDGFYPSAALVQGSDGNFYGTTAGGGTNDSGTVFKISPTGVLTSLHSFGSVQDTNGYSLDGVNPVAPLVQGSDGYFYGTTEGGLPNNDGTVFNNDGTVFKISTNGALTTLYSFGSVQDTNGYSLDGANPVAPLVQGSDGYFYGTTPDDALSLSFLIGNGTVFKIIPNGALTTLHAFTGGNDGRQPFGGLVQGSDGNFYGTTCSGGANDYGTVFHISTNGALTTLYSFDSYNDGGPTCTALVQGSDGYLYGTNPGSPLAGRPSTLFRISTNGQYTTLYDMGTTQLDNGLVQGSDGNFYGTTQGGGTNGNGTVFRLTIVPQPQLTLIPSGPYVLLTWPTNHTGYALQSTTDLGSSAFWATNSAGPVVIGGQNVVINTISGTQRFYRLISP